MRKFDLHVSRNYEGGQFFSTIEVDTVSQFYKELVFQWQYSYLRQGSGEIFVYTKIEFEGEVHDFQVGFYVLGKDNEINALHNTPDILDVDYDICEELGLDLDSNPNEEQIFSDLVEALLN